MIGLLIAATLVPLIQDVSTVKLKSTGQVEQTIEICSIAAQVLDDQSAGQNGSYERYEGRLTILLNRYHYTSDADQRLAGVICKAYMRGGFDVANRMLEAMDQVERNKVLATKQ